MQIEVGQIWRAKAGGGFVKISSTFGEKTVLARRVAIDGPVWRMPNTAPDHKINRWHLKREYELVGEAVVPDGSNDVLSGFIIPRE